MEVATFVALSNRGSLFAPARGRTPVLGEVCLCLKLSVAMRALRRLHWSHTKPGCALQGPFPASTAPSGRGLDRPERLRALLAYSFICFRNPEGKSRPIYEGMNHLHVEITSPIQNPMDSLKNTNFKKKKKKKGHDIIWQLAAQERAGGNISLLIICVIAPKAVFCIKESCTAQPCLQKGEQFFNNCPP